MFNIQLLSKLLMNEWRFAVGYRITKNSIGFPIMLPLSKQFTRQGIADF